jgi:hypothetical protein
MINFMGSGLKHLESAEEQKPEQVNFQKHGIVTAASSMMSKKRKAEAFGGDNSSADSSDSICKWSLTGTEDEDGSMEYSPAFAIKTMFTSRPAVASRALEALDQKAIKERRTAFRELFMQYWAQLGANLDLDSAADNMACDFMESRLPSFPSDENGMPLAETSEAITQGPPPLSNDNRIRYYFRNRSFVEIFIVVLSASLLILR